MTEGQNIQIKEPGIPKIEDGVLGGSLSSIRPSSVIGEAKINFWSREMILKGAFKFANMIHEFMPMTTTGYILLLLFEFLIMGGLLFQNIDLESYNTLRNSVNSVIPNQPSGFDSDKNGTGFYIGYYINYLTLQEALMVNTNQNESYVALSLVLCFLSINFIGIGILITMTTDGFEVLLMKSTMKTLIRIVSLAQILLLKLFFVPIYQVFTSFLVCAKENDGTVFQSAPDSQIQHTESKTMVNLYYDKYECWTLSHIFIVLIIAIFAVSFFILMIVISLLLQDPRAHSNLVWACPPNRIEAIKSFQKLLVVFSLNIYLVSKQVFIVGQAFNLVASALILHLRCKNFYFPNIKIQYASIIQEAAIFWLALVTLIINQILLQISYSAFVFLIASTLGFSISFAILMHKRDRFAQLNQFPSFTKVYQFENFFLNLLAYFKDTTYKQIDKIVLFGLIKHHQSDCQDQNCVCEFLFQIMSQNRLEYYLSQFDDKAMIQLNQLMMEEQTFKINEQQMTSVNEQNQVMNSMIVDLSKIDHKNDPRSAKKFEEKFKTLLFKFYFVLLSNVLKKYPKSMKLKYLSITCLKYHMNSEFKALFSIIKTQTEKPSLEWQFFLYQARQRVERIMFTKYTDRKSDKNGIDIIKIYEFEEMFVKFENQVVNTANNCLHFWKELMENRQTCDVNQIHDFGVQIANIYQEVSDLANKMLEMYPNHLMLLKIYAYFLSDVMNNDEMSFEINSRVKSYIANQTYLKNKMSTKIQQDENRFFGYNTNTVLITMTVTPKDIGKIVNANFETKELLGYRGKEIKGKNVRILMPKLLSDNHDSFIQNYFETAKAKILEVKRVVIAKDKQGYLVPIHILVKAIPNLKRNLTFVGFLKKVDESDSFLQPPSSFAGQEYHIILVDSEGQIHGFTKNCWETFGFNPQFFFNRFGDPEQQIKIEKIIKNLRNPSFIPKVEAKKDGSYCCLETSSIMETISKELLSKSEQEVLKTISGSYNINLQVTDMKFADGKISLKVFKILKVSRIIRSQNVLDMISGKVDEMNELTMDSEKDYDESSNSNSNAVNEKSRGFDSLDQVEEDGKKDESISLSERSITSTLHLDKKGNRGQTSKYLQTFKMQISNKRMPQSIVNLNRLVMIFVAMVLLISILDMAQQSSFYDFLSLNQDSMQKLFKKQNYIAQISSNILWIALMNRKIIPSNYSGYQDLKEQLFQVIQKEKIELGNIENDIQDQSFSYLVYNTYPFRANPNISYEYLNLDGSQGIDEQSMRLFMSQYISKVQQNAQSSSSLQLTPEIYRLQSIQNSSARSQAQTEVFFLVMNTLDVLSQSNNQLNNDLLLGMENSLSQNKNVLIVLFVFNTIFVMLCGVIVFPIVIGVQKNKVMILSIYYDLPKIEIENAFHKCLYFMAKLESKLDEKGTVADEAIFAKKLIQFEEQVQRSSILKDHVSTELRMQRRLSKHPNSRALDVHVTSFHKQPINFIEEEIEESESYSSSSQSSRDTSRQMIAQRASGQGLNSAYSPEKVIERDSDPNTSSDLFVQAKRGSMIYQKSQSVKRIIRKKQKAYQRQMQNSQSFNASKTPVELEDIKIEEEEENDETDKQLTEGLDKSKMFRDIRVQNSKLNFITGLVIFCFVTFFIMSFAVNYSFLSDIKESLHFQYELYSEKHSLQYSFLYFIGSLMQNRDIYSTSNTSQTFLETYIKNLQKIQSVKEGLKRKNQTGVLQGPAVDFIRLSDSSFLCDEISLYLENDYDRQQCSTFGDLTLKIGMKHTVSTTIYQFQQLIINFNKLRHMQNSTALVTLLQDPFLQHFQILSNIYLQASFRALLDNCRLSIRNFYSKIQLFVKLKLAFFVIFTLFISTVVWRVFLKNIKSEIFRSKGMLNMIPTEFLERQKNLKNLALNKLINLQK